MKNGPRVWAFCKIEFPGIQKPVQIFGQKMAFFKKCGNRGVGVIWPVRGVVCDFCLVVGCGGVVFCFLCVWCLVGGWLGTVFSFVLWELVCLVLASSDLIQVVKMISI